LRPRKKIAKGESVSENLTLRLPQSRVFYLLVPIAHAGGFVSAWTHHLSGSEGELIQIRVATEPKRLEELLDCLASLSFPINPQIYHGVPTVVEFPAYQSRLSEVSDAIRVHGFDPTGICVSTMLQAITAA
jgi:hypothetical protein